MKGNGCQPFQSGDLNVASRSVLLAASAAHITATPPRFGPPAIRAHLLSAATTLHLAKIAMLAVDAPPIPDPQGTAQ